MQHTHNRKTPHHATQALEAQLEVVEGRVDLANLGVDHRLALVVQMLVQSLLQTGNALNFSNLSQNKDANLETNGLIVRGTVVAEVEPHVEVGRGCNDSISTLERHTERHNRPGSGSSVLESTESERRREIVARLVASPSRCSGKHSAATTSPLLRDAEEVRIQRA